MDSTIAFGREHGYVQTLTGRRRYLRDIRSANATVRGAAERNAINMPIQATAADMIKLAMVNIAAELRARGLKSRMLLQVHDELVFEVAQDQLEPCTNKIRTLMCSAADLKVPLLVDIGVGDNWDEAH